MNLAAVRDRALAMAFNELGVREEGGNNCGRRIGEYQAFCHLGPGEPWCMCMVQFLYRAAAREVMAESPLPVSGACCDVWHRVPDLWRSDQPTRAAIAIHLKEPQNRWSLGHTGLVISFGGGQVQTIEGNTNEAGERDGDCVALKSRPASYWLGYIDIGREGPT